VSAYEGSKLAKRPAGAALMSVIQKGDHLLVWSIDRLFRNVGDYGTTLDTFKKMGVSVHFIRDGIDLATASGQLKADILAVMAQHWSRMIGFRNREAHRIKKAREQGSVGKSKPILPPPKSREVIEDLMEAQAVESSFAVRPAPAKPRGEAFKAGNRVWGYIRVSSTGQVESGLGLEHQRQQVEQCMDEMVQQGSQKMEIISDDAVSSFRVSFANRPGGKRILEEAQAGDVVAVYRFDRIFRSLGDAIKQIAEFRQRGISLRMIEEGIQTNDTTSDWYLSLLGTFAELESRIKSERVIEALQKRKRMGLQYCKHLMLYRPFNINGQKRWRLNIQLIVRIRMSHILVDEYGFTIDDACHIANAFATDSGWKWIHFTFHNKPNQRKDAVTPRRYRLVKNKWNEFTELIGRYATANIEKKVRQKLAAGISEEAFILCKRARVSVKRLYETLIVGGVDRRTADALTLGNASVPLPGIEDL